MPAPASSPARWICAGTPASVEAELAFTRPQDVAPDHERRPLLRARTLRPDALLDHRSYDRHRCTLTDCSALPSFRSDLRVHGFTHADLSGHEGLQAVLRRILAAGEVGERDARQVRRCLRGSVLPLADGRRLRLLYIAPEGFIMRTAGPNGLSVNPRATNRGINHHDAAMAVHADQDVRGTPVRQILRGAAPWLFAHDSPGDDNARSPVFLLNLWIPLRQVTRPLALMDHRSVDRLAHQLRYGLPTDDFLERAPDRAVNDIWTFLHDPGQRWYFTSALDSNTAYVFNTLSTPHGAFVLPGEERAEVLYQRLQAACEAVQGGDDAALREALGSEVERSSGRGGDDGDRGERGTPTATLQRAIAGMEALIDEARGRAPELCRGVGADDWRARALRGTDRVVRKSLEMRAIGVLTPRRPWA